MLNATEGYNDYFREKNNHNYRYLSGQYPESFPNCNEN